mmetsp:Transcript_1414/g.3273  ORF Transcript_1414/g.3273 Transcript_1414/m.3273 type:complete len:234 (-) Transcript_1414:222-923(-)
MRWLGVARALSHILAHGFSLSERCLERWAFDCSVKRIVITALAKPVGFEHQLQGLSVVTLWPCRRPWNTIAGSKCCFGVLHRPELDEAEATRLPSFTVVRNLYKFHLPVPREDLLNVTDAEGYWQTFHIERPAYWIVCIRWELDVISPHFSAVGIELQELRRTSCIDELVDITDTQGLDAVECQQQLQVQITIIILKRLLHETVATQVRIAEIKVHLFSDFLERAGLLLFALE